MERQAYREMEARRRQAMREIRARREVEEEMYRRQLAQSTSYNYDSDSSDGCIVM